MNSEYHSIIELFNLLERIKAGGMGTISYPKATHLLCKEIISIKKRLDELEKPPETYAEWGGTMTAIIDGEVKNVAEHLNELHQ